MKQHIIVDDRFKIGQYLLGIAKSLMPTNKSVKIISDEEYKKHLISEKDYSQDAIDTVESIKNP